MSERRPLPAFAAPSALFIVTFVSAIASIAFSRFGEIAAFWPVNGVALVVLLRLRPRLDSRIAAWIGIAAALLLANLVGGNGAVKSVWFTLGNLVEIAVAYAVLRSRPGAVSIEHGRFVSILPRVMFAALAGPACGALTVGGGLSFALDAPPLTIWQQWWLPDVLGMLVVVPLGLFVSLGELKTLREPENVRRILLGAAAIAAIAITIVVMRFLAPILFVAPLAMLAAVRFRALGAALTIAAAAWCIAPLAGGVDLMRNAAVPEPWQRVTMVQAFMALSGFLALGVSALLDERDALARALDARRIAATEAAQDRLRLLMNVAHEIRTPLNVIQGCGDMAVRAGPLTARQKDLLDTVTAASRQLQVLASDLLEAARLEHSAITLSAETFAPHDVLMAAVADVRASLAWEGPVLVSASCETMWADPQRFRQVATNLISNAVKFGGAYGPVRVSLKQSASAVILSVADCGPGLPPGRAHNIFEPFAASSGQVTKASAGVGLSLVKQLVEAHGGKARCFSAPFIETRVEAEFPVEGAPGAVSRQDTQEDLRSVDPDTVF
jgi:signal transduction histidine kinase